jgi:glycosyltransferase involved in cell wall biosynthesis
MPMRNAEVFLTECILSIQKQQFESWELIIINDHSTDKSVEIATSIANKDTRISIYHNPSKGIISALNLAFEKSKGHYISRMDADDIMPLDRLHIMMTEILSSKGKTIVTGLVNYFSDVDVSKGYLKYENWINTVNSEGTQWQNVYRECVIASPNWIVNKEDLKLIGGFKNLIYPEDYDLVLKWYTMSFQIKVIQETTLFWREHSKRTSRNSNNYSQQKFFELKLNVFINHDLGSGQLVLWGTEKKGRLTASIFDKRGIDFLWMDLKNGKNKIDSHKTSNFRNIESIQNPRLLISAYPNNKERQQIESYLNSLDMKLGIDYWYL